MLRLNVKEKKSRRKFQKWKTLKIGHFSTYSTYTQFPTMNTFFILVYGFRLPKLIQATKCVTCMT